MCNKTMIGAEKKETADRICIRESEHAVLMQQSMHCSCLEVAVVQSKG